MRIYRILGGFLIVLAALMTVACSDDGNSGPGDGFDNGPGSSSPVSDPSTVPAASVGGNSLTYAGNTRPLTHGIVDVLNNARGHQQVNYNVSDSEYTFSFYTASGFLYSYWFPVADTVEFSVDLYSPSVDELLPGTYEYVDISEIRGGDPTLGRAVFSQTKVSWDFNGDGTTDSDEELPVVGGNVTLRFASGNNADVRSAVLTWDVLLVDGQRSTGLYMGDFQLIE